MNDSLYVDIDAITTKFNNKLNAAVSKLDAVSSNFVSIGAKMSLGLTAPLLLAATQMRKYASNIQESRNKVEVVFGGMSDDVKSFAKTSLDSFGIAEASALEMAGLFGDMATGMGINSEAASTMSQKLTGLSADLASFKNISIERAKNALTGVFTGETESLKGLGIVMTQANLKAFALTKGFDGNIASLNEAEKVQLRYQYILAKTTNAQGDFARTIDSDANQARIFSESIKELSSSFGETLLPVATKVTMKLNGMMNVLNSLDETTRQNLLLGGGIVAAIGPVLLVTGKLMKAFSGLNALAAGLGSTVFILGTALAGTAYYVLTHWEKVRSFFYDLEKGFFKFKLALGSTLHTLGFISAEEAFGDLAQGFEKVTRWTKDSESGVQGFANSLKKAKTDAKALFAEFGKGGQDDEVINKKTGVERSKISISKVDNKQGVFDNNSAMSSGLSTIATDMFGSSDDISKRFKKHIDEVKEGISTEMKSFTDWNAILTADLSLITQNQFADFWEGLGLSFEKGVDVVSGLVSNVTNALADTLSTGLASIFNQDVDFDFKSLLSQFLSAMGDMFISMAAPLITAWTLANIAGVGSFSDKMGASLGLLGAGIAMKGGGIALGNTNTNAGISSTGSFSAAPNYSANMQTQKVEISGNFGFQNGALTAQLAHDNNRRGR